MRAISNVARPDQCAPFTPEKCNEPDLHGVDRGVADSARILQGHQHCRPGAARRPGVAGVTTAGCLPDLLHLKGPATTRRRQAATEQVLVWH